MKRFAVTFAIVAVSAAAIAAPQMGPAASALAVGTPAASPIVCPTRSASTPAASPVASVPDETIGVVTIAMTDKGFDPARFESAVGQDVQVTLHNRGSRPHSFTIDRLQIDVLVPPGETREVTIPLPDLGEYAYTSTAPCDEDMAGEMFIFI